MSLNLSSSDLALTGIFASLYAVLAAIPLFPVVGLVGKSFTLAVIIAPLVGLIIGPHRGALAASIGGFIAWSITQFGPLFQFSFVPGAATALGSGYLYKGKWKQLVVIYAVFFLALAFYPAIGPMWLYPPYLWFQLLGLIVLISLARVKLKALGNSRMQTLSFKVGAISFASTLFGHIIGGLIFNAIYFPAFYPSIDYWRGLWQILVFVYPLERSIVVLVSVLIGAPLIKALLTHGFEIGGK